MLRIWVHKVRPFTLGSGIPEARRPFVRKRRERGTRPEALRLLSVKLPGDGRMRPVQEEWSRKGATLSDKTARKEFGLTQDEIVAAIDAGQLQYRVGVIHGNPWLRLLRREVEELMKTTYNDRAHGYRRARAEVGAG